jgi:hypothetical protein
MRRYAQHDIKDMTQCQGYRTPDIKDICVPYMHVLYYVCAVYVCRVCIHCVHVLHVCRYEPHDMKDMTQYQGYRTPDIKDIARHLARLVGQPVHGRGRDAIVLQIAGHLGTCSSVPISHTQKSSTW